MVKQLDFGLPPNLTECFNLQFENNRGFIHTKVRKNDRGTSQKKNVCLLPPFGSRHSRSSCNLCLKDRQKRPQVFSTLSGAFRCFSRCGSPPIMVWHLPKKHTCGMVFQVDGKFLTWDVFQVNDFCSKTSQGKGERKEYPFAIWSAWSTLPLKKGLPKSINLRTHLP